MGDNLRDRGPFCVVLKGIPKQLSESEVLQAVEEFKPLHAKTLPDSRWIVSLKTKQDAEDAQRTAQCQFSYDQHEFTFDIMACEQNQIPEEWIQSEKVDDTVDDLYGDQPTTILAAQTCGYRACIIQSVQTKTSSVFFSTSPEQYLLQVQQSAHHGFQQNPSSYIHPMTGHQFGQQSPYQSRQFYSQYSIQAPLSRRIKVSCLPQGIKPDVLKMFFETVLDGTYIKDLSFNPDSSAAVIEFNDPSVTDRVLLTSPLTLKGKQLKIEPYTESDENEKQFDNTNENDDIPKTTVEVTGFSKDLTKDILEMYFENQKWSGGGPIRNIELKEEACLITFETEAATSAVLKRSHKLSEIKLDVKLYVPSKSAAMYEDRMLVTGPHEKITGDFLTIFIEHVGGVSPKEILFSEEDEEKALVIFERPPDLKRLIENCRMKKQQGARLAFSLVPISRCILVTNFALSISQEMVMIYFETTKRSGGGPVEKVEMLEEGACLVYFEDDSAIESVISRHHKLGNAQLHVQLFYPCIGRTTSAENSRKFQNPEPVDYKVNLYVCLFLKQMPNVMAWVEQEMTTVHGRLIVPSENSDTLTVVSTLTSEMEGVKRLVKIWKGNAVQRLEECIKQVNCMEYEVVPDIWDSTLLALEKIKITDENKVAVFTDKKHNIIRVVGYKDMVDQTSHNLKRIIDDEEKELEMKKQRTFYRKNLPKQEIYFLSSVNFPDNVHKRYSNVKCTIQQEDMIVFEGTFTEIKQAESFMDETLKSIKNNYS